VSARPAYLGPLEAGDLPVGMTLHRRYVLLRRIARTAMSAVYLARDLAHDRLCVVKRLAPTERAPAYAGCLQAFCREAAVLRTLAGPFPRLYGLHRDAFGWYTVLEYIPGPTLAQLVATGRPAQAEALRIAEGLIAALAALHERQPPLVYGDLHPRNVIVQPEGAVVLIDMGLARPAGSDPPELRGVGVPAYASPEQIGGLPLDPRSDLFSLAVLLEELLDREHLPERLRTALELAQAPLRSERRVSLAVLAQEVWLARRSATSAREANGQLALLASTAIALAALLLVSLALLGG